MNGVKIYDGFSGSDGETIDDRSLADVRLYIAEYSGDKLTRLNMPTFVKISSGIKFEFEIPLTATYKIMLRDGVTPLTNTVTKATQWRD